MVFFFKLPKLRDYFPRSFKRSSDDLDCSNTSNVQAHKRRRIDSGDHRMNFDAFPTQFQRLIFENLNFTDLMAASRVSKEWTKVINNSKELTQQILFNYHENAPMNRKYVHIAFDRLPSRDDYEQRFVEIRDCVQSIELKLHIANCYECLRKFLEFFPNLNSLKLIETKDLGEIPSCHKSPIASKWRLNGIKLPSLKKFHIESQSMRFFGSLLSVAKVSQLNEFTLNCHAPVTTNIFKKQEEIASMKLLHFLSNQSDLKVLGLQIFSSQPMLTSSSTSLDFGFKLDKLKVEMIPSKLELIDALLGSSYDSCTHLDFVCSSAECCGIYFISRLYEFTSLQTLKLDVSKVNFAVTSSSSLAQRKMKSEIKYIIICGLNGQKDDIIIDSITKLLLTQKNSLQKLVMTDDMSSNERLWTVIGTQMMNLKTICVPLSAVAQELLHVRSKSLQHLIDISGRPMIDKLKLSIMELFKIRCPNFKSITCGTLDVALANF